MTPPALCTPCCGHQLPPCPCWGGGCLFLCPPPAAMPGPISSRTSLLECPQFQAFGNPGLGLFLLPPASPLVPWAHSCPGSSTCGFSCPCRSGSVTPPQRDTGRDSQCPWGPSRFLSQRLEVPGEAISHPSAAASLDRAPVLWWWAQGVPGELLSPVTLRGTWQPPAPGAAPVPGAASPRRSTAGLGGSERPRIPLPAQPQQSQTCGTAFLPRPVRASASLTCQELLTGGASRCQPFPGSQPVPGALPGWGRLPGLGAFGTSSPCPVPCAQPQAGLSQLLAGHSGARKGPVPPAGALPSCSRPGTRQTHPKGMLLAQQWGCRLSCLPSTHLR